MTFFDFSIFRFLKISTFSKNQNFENFIIFKFYFLDLDIIFSGNFFPGIQKPYLEHRAMSLQVRKMFYSDNSVRWCQPQWLQQVRLHVDVTERRLVHSFCTGTGTTKITQRPGGTESSQTFWKTQSSCFALSGS